MKRSLAVTLCVAFWALVTLDVRSMDRAAASGQVLNPSGLTSTAHPPISRNAADLWLVPTVADSRRAADKPLLAFKAGVQVLKEGQQTQALRVLTPLLTTSTSPIQPLDNYAAYYAAIADFRLNNLDEAQRRLTDLRERLPQGYLAEAAAVADADVAEAQSNYSRAVQIYEELSQQKTAVPEEIWIRLGRAALAAGDRAKAVEALTRVYYEFPFSAQAAEARAELDRLQGFEPLAPQNARYRLEIARAERLFAARRYADAQSAFDALRREVVGNDKDLVALRLAECDYYRGKYRAAREALSSQVVKGTHQAEALYFYASALRNLESTNDFIRATHDVVDNFPGSFWAEDALNDLATYDIKQDDDDAADQVLRELYSKFPGGRYAERAGWKIGWRAYRARQYDEAISYFERTAAQFPRSDYRPPFLYWSGRSHEALDNQATANARYTLAAADYLNTYYGRLAAERLTRRGQPVPLTSLRFSGTAQSPIGASQSDLPPTRDVIRSLLSLGLYDEAMDELRFAQRTWGDSPIVLATIGWVYNQEGDFRSAIVAAKRAYPQYMASGGELLPQDMLKLIFPLDYWSDIRAQALRNNLSPYLLAALVAQESAFDARIKSSANAVGLMQLLPSTGRLYARRLKLGAFRSSMLTSAKTNLTMGSAYFADLIKKFGEPHLALAAYNAGDSRVARWIAEREGEDLNREEFIDDIPFPETQAYVKKILSTAEDYRRLYGTADEARASR